MSVAVVYVHGLWLTGREAAWLRRQVADELQAENHLFTYPSVTAGIAENAAALGKYLRDVKADTVHLIGHSLGGIVILKLFEDAPFGQSADMRWRAMPETGQAAPAVGRPAPATGRIVLLGSPLGGSRSAQGLARWPGGKKIMGLGIAEEVLRRRERRWDGARDLGVIAGDLSLGLGRLVGSLAGPNDGTILVEETEFAGATDRIVLRVSHTGMLFSAAVARQTVAFLRDGAFAR
jgi:pimeloyl-ACP methyl ester carboxylesterase